MSEIHDVKAEVIPPAPVTTQALSTTPQNVGVARPIVTPAQAKEIIQEWTDLKSSVLREVDIRRETRTNKNTGEVTDVSYIKKSGWRNLATFFGLAVEVVPGTEKIEVIGGTKLASVTYRASALNGRACSGDGHCGGDEPGKYNWTLSNLAATAHTRAFNRAVSNLIGGGEVSADEIGSEEKENRKTEPARPSAKAAALAEMLIKQLSADSLKATWETVDKAHKAKEINDKEYKELAGIKDTRKAVLG